MKNKKVLWLVSLLMAAACSGLPINGNNNGNINSSGRISALQVDVASGVGGIVSAIDVEEGNTVATGDILFRIDDTLIQAQYDQAAAMVGVAESSVESAYAQLAPFRVFAIKKESRLTLFGKKTNQMTLIYLFGISLMLRT
jgi:HlyD family secretion protein